MLGDEHCVHVVGTERVTGVEIHADRRRVGLNLDLGRDVVRRVVVLSVFGVADGGTVDVRETVVGAGFGDAVDLLRRDVVAHHVAPVVREPQLIGLGVPCHADGIANAVGVHGGLARTGIHAQDAGEAFIRLVADIAGRTDGVRRGSRPVPRTGISSRGDTCPVGRR